jgi:CheY-like chemotaxis protein
MDETTPTPDKQSILVVEDDLYMRDLYIEILTDAGFGVATAKDGAEGLARIREGGFDLILLDVMMPVKNGLEVLEGLKESPPVKPNGPIILLTNLARDPILNEALTLGAHACLIKTDVDPDQLVSRIRGFLTAA